MSTPSSAGRDVGCGYRFCFCRQSQNNILLVKQDVLILPESHNQTQALSEDGIFGNVAINDVIISDDMRGEFIDHASLLRREGKLLGHG